MTLKITKESEPIRVETLIVALYAVPGLGKTTLGFMAHNPLLLDFDNGAHRAGNRKDTVRVYQWSDVATISAEDVADYDTIVVDTAGRLLDQLATDIMRREPKMGRAGALTLQGFGRLKSEFASWTKLLRSFGKDLVLLAHSDEQKSGDDLIERLDMQGSSKNEVYKVADAMGRLSIVNGQRTLSFSPTDTAFGKNPAQLDALTVPDFRKEPEFLGNILDGIKDSLNQQTEEQQEVTAMLEEWRAAIDDCDTPDAMNDMLEKIGEADERVRDNVKRLLWEAAKERGITFDTKEKAFKEAA